MKSVFGFLTGAVIGAGGLLGLRKALNALDKTESPAPTSATSLSSPTSHAVESSLSKFEEASTSSGVKDEATSTTSAPEVSQDSAEKSDEPASLVGEPIARHSEPVAATQTDPEATTPRSETSEPAVPEEPEVKSAATAAPVENKATTDARNSSPKKSKKNSAKSRTDDFTVILDIGPVFNQKLHEAGIKSYKALAKLTPAQIADRTGIPAERIENGRWIEKVQKLLAGEEKK